MKAKYLIREFIDFFLISVFWYVFLRYAGMKNPEAGIIVSLLQVVLFRILGLYKINWQYLNFFHFSVMLAVNATAFVCYAAGWIIPEMDAGHEGDFFRQLFFIATGFLSSSFVLSSHRIFWFFYLNPESMKKKTGDTSIILYGAGTVTMSLLQDLRTGDLIGKYHIVAITDNNPDKIGSRLGPYKIQNSKNIQAIVEKYKVKEIWLTMPVNSVIVDDVFNRLKSLPVMYKVVPRKFEEILPDIRSLRIEDLIQRPEIRLSQQPLEKIFKNKRILVTGAAGSIGSEIARQLQSFPLQRLVLLDQNERGVYDLEREFAGKTNTSCLICDIRNPSRILDVIYSEKPQIIFHAAAYKHVPLMEKNFTEALNTNILGTYNLLSCIQNYLKNKPGSGDIKLVNISTDKAVSPENIMGLSKRIAELLVHNAAVDTRKLLKKNRLQTVSVRFGNVLSSSGSVVPLFWEQIQNGGPLTVTHPDMERFFMTVPEAVNLVLHGMLEISDDSILALDMGKPVKILHMAERLILLSGMIPYRDIDIQFIGIRPGEKLKEELFWTKNSVKTSNPYIFKSQEDLKKLNSQDVIRMILEAQKEKKSLHWWKQFLKQFV